MDPENPPEPAPEPAPEVPDGPQSRAFGMAVDDVSKPRRTVTARINTGCVDRFRTVVPPGGGDLSRFRSSPAVLWEHGLDPTRGRMPIGHCSSVKFRRLEDDLLAVTQFKADDYSDRIFNDYADGVLTGFSIDFLPDPSAASRPTSEEVRNNPGWAGAAVVFRKWELTGYSAVAYGGNPEALALAVERGLWVPEELRRTLPTATRGMSEGSGSSGGYTTKQEGARWVVRNAAGEPVGDFDDEEQAARACAKMAAPTPTPAELPAVRTYTADELAATIGRRVFEPLFAMLDQRLKDHDDLMRGRV